MSSLIAVIAPLLLVLVACQGDDSATNQIGDSDAGASGDSASGDGASADGSTNADGSSTFDAGT
ncbi:MAG: hypothetical protein ABI461_00260, partial [Polyangiaceae bacterium]